MTPENDPQDHSANKPSDETLPSRANLEGLQTSEATRPSKPKPSATAEKAIHPAAASEPHLAVTAGPAAEEKAVTPVKPPWTLQQFFNGEIDLDVELAKRFPNMPVMSAVNFRTLGARTGRGVATLATADGAASVIFDADAATREVQVSFTYGSMLTLRFALSELSDLERSRWLELMRREQGGLAFLWGPGRWENDYVICIARKYFTNFYAFSPRSFEAAIRMTPDVTRKLLDWLEEFWKTPPPSEEPPKLLTW